VAVASAGPYASLNLAPYRQPCQHPTTQVFYRPDALPAAQTNSVKALKAQERQLQVTENKINRDITGY